MDKTSISLVLPCYQEAAHLEESVAVILSTLEMLKVDYEVIFVDDASEDSTPSVIRKIIASNPGADLKAVFHPSNKGRGAAFLSGARIAKGQYVGFFDVDLEISPGYLADVLAELRSSHSDLVLARRVYSGDERSYLREFLSRSYSVLSHGLLRIPRELDTESGYKFFRRNSLAFYFNCFTHSGWFWDTEVVSRFVWDGRKVSWVPALFNRRASKASTVKPLADSLRYLTELWRFRKLAPHHGRSFTALILKSLKLIAAAYTLFAGGGVF